MHSCVVVLVGLMQIGAQVGGKLAAEDKEKIEKLVEETVSWLDSNQLAEVDELEHRLKELEGQCSPIISKIYGGAEGAAPGGAGPMPDMPQSGGASSGPGPKIEVGFPPPFRQPNCSPYLSVWCLFCVLLSCYTWTASEKLIIKNRRKRITVYARVFHAS